MFESGRRRWHLGAAILVLVGLVLVTAPGRQALARAASGVGIFLGASPGSPIPYAVLNLPEVVVGPLNDPPALAIAPFTPTFAELVNGETVITTELQFRHVWRRLFPPPFDDTLVDFDTEFVVLAGGGLMHPFFGFDITNVEGFESEFEAVMKYKENSLEPGVAVLAVTVIPGAKPPKKDPVYKLSAVVISTDNFGDVIVNRQEVALALP